MVVHVGLAGPLRVVIGASKLELDVPDDPATVSQAIDTLAARFPRARRYLRDEAGGLNPALRVLAAGIRQDIGDIETVILHDGDSLTLLTPVSGG